jgi:hypothetical protein
LCGEGAQLLQALVSNRDATCVLDQGLTQAYTLATTTTSQRVWRSTGRTTGADVHGPAAVLQSCSSWNVTIYRRMPGCCVPYSCMLVQDLLLPPIPQLLGLDAPISQQQQAGCGGGSSALSLPGAGAGGLMLQAWNFTGMLTGGGLGSRSQNSGGASGQGPSQGHAAAAVDDAISRALQLRDQLYGQQLMQGFDPQELRMVSGAQHSQPAVAGLPGCRSQGLCNPPFCIQTRTWAGVGLHCW